MLWAGLSNREAKEDKPQRHSFWLLALMELGTSIDAMAIGVSLAVLDLNIVATAAAIGFTTLVMATAGVMVGRVLGAIASRRAEMLSGLLLIGIGGAILFEHLSLEFATVNAATRAIGMHKRPPIRWTPSPRKHRRAARWDG